jgi:hypothetical protein
VTGKVLDINASDTITIDATTSLNITSSDLFILENTNPFSDITITSAGTTSLTSGGQTTINSNILDINTTAQTTLDTSALTSFVGSSSGSITKWYNQGSSGGVNNFIQSSAGSQPFIVNSGVTYTAGTTNKPTIYFNGAL